jgi:hypothetical protein
VTKLLHSMHTFLHFTKTLNHGKKTGELPLQTFSSDKQTVTQTPVTKTTVPHFYKQQITRAMVLDIEIDDTMKIIQKARDMTVNKV